MHGCFGWSFLGEQLSTTKKKKKDHIFIYISNKEKTTLTSHPPGVIALSRCFQDTEKDNHFTHFDLSFTENVLQGL